MEYGTKKPFGIDDFRLLSLELKKEEKNKYAGVMLATASKNDLSSALADLTGYLYQRYRARPSRSSTNTTRR